MLLFLGMKTQVPEEIIVDLYGEPQIPGTIAAIYDSIAQAGLSAGLPKVRVDDGITERAYKIKDILGKKSMPIDSKIFFEFGCGNNCPLIYSKIEGDKLRMKTENFLEGDEELLYDVLRKIDLARPLSESCLIPEKPVEVSLASLFPESVMPKRNVYNVQPNRFEVSLASLPEPEGPKPTQIEPANKRRRGNELVGEELKAYMRNIIAKDRNTPFQQILIQYSADGHKLPTTPKANMRRKDEMCETYNQLRKTIKMDYTSNYGNKAPPKVVQQKIPVAKPIAPTIQKAANVIQKEIVQKIPESKPIVQSSPKITPEPVKIASIVPSVIKQIEAPKVKVEPKPKKKLPWDEQKVMGIVENEYKQKHNFSQVIARLADYNLSKANKNSVYDRFTELMGI
jgi:hypothetical protein